MKTISLYRSLKILTTQREIQGGGTKYDAVLLVDSNLSVSSQIIKTTLKAGEDKVIQT